MNNLFSKLVNDNDYLIADGATGTNMILAGLPPGRAPDLWNLDGIEHVANLHTRFIEAGANIIVSEKRQAIESNIPIIIVENSRKALSRLASNFYKNPSLKINIVGITGTNGKTSVSQIVKQLLDALGSSCGALGTLGFSINQDIVNTGFTTPESIELHGMLKLLGDSNTNNAVLEVSSHSLDQHRVDDVNYIL